MPTTSVIKAVLIATSLLCLPHLAAAAEPKIDIGVYYFPGWHSKSDYWNDLKGLPGSRSPGKPWPGREPLLGYYPEEESWVAEKHIDWAVRHGITFFAHEFYWRHGKPALEHALKAHLKAKNSRQIEFSLFWANEGGSPPSLDNFDAMVQYWLKEYTGQPNYYRVNGRPLVFIFDPDTLTRNAKQLGVSTKELIERANAAARAQGEQDFYFVALLSFYEPSDRVEEKYLAQGYSAYSAYNYVAAKEKAQYADYDSMVQTHLDFYREAAQAKGKLPYLPSASPGYDGRPWAGTRPKIHVRLNPTPAKFRKILEGARELLQKAPAGAPRILTIGAWNEFGEGSYIEPTREWGMQYLEVIRAVFGTNQKKK